MEDFNRRMRVEALIEMAGSMPDFPSNEEVEAADIKHEEKMDKRRTERK